MTSFFMYLIESTAVLALLYLLYVLVLSKETFFNLNRFFLIGILMFSLAFPFLSFDFNQAEVVAVERSVEEISKIRTSYYEALALWDFAGRTEISEVQNIDDQRQLLISDKKWIDLVFFGLLVVYISGVLFCLSRLIWTLRRIRKLITQYTPSELGGVKVISLPYATAPFSFMNFIFVHHALLDTPDFEQIMAHEKTHIDEKHSVDLLFVQLVAAFLWFNPVVWWLIKSLKTTHEYIADRKTISSGYSLVAYQTLLLRQLISNNSFGLIHNFNLSFIKKRITMMKNKSGWSGKVKVAMAIICSVLFSGLIVQCSSRLEEHAILAPADKLQFSVEIEGIENRDIFDQGILISDLDQMTIGSNKKLVEVDEFEITLARKSVPLKFQEVQGNTYNLALFSELAESGDRIIIEVKNLVAAEKKDLSVKNSVLTIRLK